MKNRTCIHCGFEFEFRPGKPGKINECWECAVETVEKKAGIMAWDGKHTPVLITCSQQQADDWRKKHARRGASVCSGCGKPGGLTLSDSIESGGSSPNDYDKTYNKKGSGVEKGAIYYTKNGEKRTIK